MGVSKARRAEVAARRAKAIQLRLVAVESEIHMVSCQTSVSAARIRVSRLICGRASSVVTGGQAFGERQGGDRLVVGKGARW
ncbi:hypothetical protein [Actinomadura miaoliensis]|uniref:Uncharacterized protein n=1 Tax=Actinomadura miaoliensis TaxID=430685 RepID=A0ABP7V8M1_9ACTN